MRNSITLFLIVLAIMLASCIKPAVYDTVIDIPNEQWNVDSIAIFNVDISDTTSAHGIYLNIRNTTSYPNSNLFLFIQTTSPQGATLTDTLECFLANTRGEWLGKGFGAIRDNRVPYKRYIRFPEEGTYVFQIQHGMRTHKLKGIASVVVRVVREDN